MTTQAGVLLIEVMSLAALVPNLALALMGNDRAADGVQRVVARNLTAPGIAALVRVSAQQQRLLKLGEGVGLLDPPGPEGCMSAKSIAPVTEW